jgi:hypothetical protein
MRVNDCEQVPHWNRLELVVVAPDGGLADAILIRPPEAKE